MRSAPLLIALLWPSALFAQDEPKDEKSAVALARAAFEFRDFQKVIDVLKPWVRPMRILEPDLKVEARALLGVSFHLLDSLEDAKAEFGDLLLLEPKHQLDPFVVPPEVIATFEAVRRELKPTLDKILKERGENPDPEPPVDVKIVTEPHPALAVLPFGVPQFLMGEAGWGSFFAIIETISLGLNIGAWYGTGAADTEPTYRAWRVIMFTSLAASLLAYAANIVHGVILLNSSEPDVQPAP